MCNAQSFVHELSSEKYHNASQNLTPLKQDFVRPQIPK